MCGVDGAERSVCTLRGRHGAGKKGVGELWETVAAAAAAAERARTAETGGTRKWEIAWRVHRGIQCRIFQYGGKQGRMDAGVVQEQSK